MQHQPRAEPEEVEQPAPVHNLVTLNAKLTLDYDLIRSIGRLGEIVVCGTALCGQGTSRYIWQKLPRHARRAKRVHDELESSQGGLLQFWLARSKLKTAAGLGCFCRACKKEAVDRQTHMAERARHCEEEPREGHAFEVDCSSGLADLAALVAARPHKMARIVDAPVSANPLRDALVPWSPAWIGSMTYVSASYRDTRQDFTSIWCLDSSGSTSWGTWCCGPAPSTLLRFEEEVCTRMGVRRLPDLTDTTLLQPIDAPWWPR